MLWVLVIIPTLFIITVVVVALLLGNRDRKKEALEREERSKNLLVSNPKQAVLQKLDSIKEISEYTFIDYKAHKANVDCLYISKRGIFLIYVLGQKGSVTGEIEAQHWVNKQVEEFLLNNPLYENKRDVEIIGNIANEKTNIYQLVICTLMEEINITDNDNQVIKFIDIEKTLQSFDEVFTVDDITYYYNNIVNGKND